MTKIVHIYCPNCKTPMFSREVDNVFLCDNCGTMHIRSDGRVETIGYEFGAFAIDAKSEGERIYLPFWILDVQFDIHDISSQGGSLGNLFGVLGGNQSRNGTISMYMPAYEIDPGRFKEVSMHHTGNPPRYTRAKPEPGVKRQKCTLTAELLHQMADFIFVTGVAEKPGVLQRLDYTLNITGKRLIYLPHYLQGERYKPGY